MPQTIEDVNTARMTFVVLKIRWMMLKIDFITSIGEKEHRHFDRLVSYSVYVDSYKENK